MAGSPPLLIIAGQPVINIEIIPEEGCVLLELGSTPQVGRVAARLFPQATLIEVEHEGVTGGAAGLHLLYFRVALDDKFRATSREIGAMVPPDVMVVLRRTSGGDFKVSGRVFKDGEMDLAVGMSKDGMLVKTAIRSNDDYDDIELEGKERLKKEAKEWARKLDALAGDEMSRLNFAAFAEEIRNEPDIARMLEQLESGEVFSDVM